MTQDNRILTPDELARIEEDSQRYDPVVRKVAKKVFDHIAALTEQLAAAQSTIHQQQEPSDWLSRSLSRKIDRIGIDMVGEIERRKQAESDLAAAEARALAAEGRVAELRELVDREANGPGACIWCAGAHFGVYRHGTDCPANRALASSGSPASAVLVAADRWERARESVLTDVLHTVPGEWDASIVELNAAVRAWRAGQTERNPYRIPAPATKKDIARVAKIGRKEMDGG